MILLKLVWWNVSNRTLKERMWKYFTDKETRRYLEILPAIMKGINHSYHRSIKLRPVDVTAENQDTVWKTLYGETLPKLEFKLELGDTVRIPLKRGAFYKGYRARYSAEIYTVSKRLAGSPPLYRVKSEEGRLHPRAFYGAELSKTGPPSHIPPVAKQMSMTETATKRTLRPQQRRILPSRQRQPPDRFSSSL